ncbi:MULTISPECIES: tetratricopeptide repeat protein [unclassified Sinorhizobium]|uniref:tetratricopeptide repeat protein n=1 Tax=unclassified Sinorhizobium TaxID=2613772 RepID=UPI0024C2A242|nr:MULTISPECIES: tetratricopeptide repeat protein [unclassified Sinorhizobium]MDK1375260.1 tetratricopeptide repeat protein [Sinorhizobium sp. 6-70]MDK1478066.1 tetratricopeptide repeat protein [Sinorhizobium sp. 6-117]
MLSRLSSKPNRVAVLLMAVALAAAPVRAQQPATGAPADEGGSDEGNVPKRGRITPFNGAILPEGAAPQQKLETPAPKKTTAGDGNTPSKGVNVIDRMGAQLPALPAEKPFTGKVDDAYGAFQRGYYLTAMDLALPRAQLGDPAAQTLVASILEQGLGVARNAEQAAFWYGQAADNGDPAAMFKYALILMEGRYVKRDRKKSEELMKKAADLGNASAQFNYGQTLVADMPGEKGLKAAMPYYEKSAEQGIADAQYALSQIYINVDGIEESKRARAREWLLRAARAGYDTAQLDIAIWFVEGIAGDRNLEEGFAWMKRAAESGNVVAQNRLSHLYVNAIGTRPDPVEAAKWYVLSRRAGLKDDALEDFYLGLNETQQKSALAAANKFRSS